MNDTDAAGELRGAPDDVSARVAVLVEASEALATAAAVDEGLQRLAQVLVAQIADVCLIDALRDDRIVRLVAAHRDTACQPLVDELLRNYPPEKGGGHPAADVLLSGGTAWRREMDDEFLHATTQDERHYELVTALGFSSFVSVPVGGEGEIVGAVSAIRCNDREPFDEQDVALLQDLARLASVHLHSARVHEERDAAEAALRDTLGQLQRLQQLTDLALVALSPNEFIEEVMHRLRRVLGADTVRILLATDDGRALRGAGALGLEDAGEWRDELPVGQGFAGRIAATRRPLVIAPRSQPFEFISPALHHLGLVAGVPLLVQGALIGVMHVGSLTPRGFDDQDLRLLELAAERIALAIDQNQRFTEERRKTLALQQTLLPVGLPDIPGCDLAARYWPADQSLAVGGDFYDVFPVTDDRYGVLIGDVSGKGISAAAFTGLARHTVRAAARHTDTVVEPLQWLHEAIVDAQTSEYCTALYGSLHTGEDHVRLEFALGGHPLPLHVRDREVQYVGTPGTALGLVPNLRFHPVSVTLEPGDMLLLYTDGVTDTRDHPLNDDQLRDLVAARRTVGCDEVLDELGRALSAMRTVQQDDIAIVAISPVDS